MLSAKRAFKTQIDDGNLTDDSNTDTPSTSTRAQKCVSTLRICSSKRIQTDNWSNSALERIDKEVQTNQEENSVEVNSDTLEIDEIGLPLYGINQDAESAFNNAASIVHKGARSETDKVKCVSLNCIRVLRHLHDLAERIYRNANRGELESDV